MNRRDLFASFALAGALTELILAPGIALAMQPTTTDDARRVAGASIALLESSPPAQPGGPVSSSDQARLVPAPHVVSSSSAEEVARVSPVTTTDEARAAAGRCRDWRTYEIALVGHIHCDR